jgi:membrane associated rhomboid family serine protease
MTSGADLFVVCNQCGSEVSPYITECPYCGHRLRRRAPKLPRARASVPAGSRARLGAALRGRGVRAGSSVSVGGYGSGRWEATRPYATIAIVALSCVAWVAWRAGSTFVGEIAGLPTVAVGPRGLVAYAPLHEHWWRVLTSQFVYFKGWYAFVALFAVAIFGWLDERRYGPAVVLALFFGAGAAGALVASAAYSLPVFTGANAGALALLAAWAAPDLRAARTGIHYEGDLLGAAAFAALLLAMPFAVYGVNWLAGMTGALLGLLVGLGLGRFSEAEG